MIIALLTRGEKTRGAGAAAPAAPAATDSARGGLPPLPLPVPAAATWQLRSRALPRLC